MAMVKEIGALYELSSEVCDLQAGCADAILPDYLCDVLQKDKSKWLELFLHFADVSNPLKPFKIYHAWALRVLDEFFAQGDEEKRLGLPVGILNDRDKVNRPGSQHGFINFLDAPLVTATVRLFPTLQDLHTQMGLNLGSWCEVR